MSEKDAELEEQDESVRIAVKALGDMRNGTQQRTENASPSEANSPFISRVSHLPIVNSAIHLYEQGKASSSVVKYGAQMMESGVKTISRPVIDRLPVNVNQLDEFACRQLDRLDRYRRPPNPESHKNAPSPRLPSPTHPMHSNIAEDPSASSSTEHRDADRPKIKLKVPSGPADVLASDDAQDHREPGAQNEPIEMGKGWKGKGKSWLQASSPFVGRPPPPPPDLDPSSSPSSAQAPAEDQQVAHRSRWQAVLLEAGGLSAALSEESMRRLKYCLQWLQYATAHIDAQILILRDFTASLQPLPSSPTRSGHPPISQAHLRTLTTVRRDIVQTVKQVVDVVSRYAGGALPEPARGRVRGFILGLPQRWAQKSGVPQSAGSSAVRDEDGERDRDKDRDRDRESVTATAAGAAGVVRRGNRRTRERGPGVSGSTPSSRAASPMTRHASRHQDEHAEPVSAGAAILTAQRILTLATESLDMMRGVTGVVKDSLDRADAWVGRLRTVGIQNRERRSIGENAVDPPPPTSTHRNQNVENSSSFDFDPSRIRHRRGASSGSHFEDNDAGIPSPYSMTSSSFSSYAGGSSVPSTPGTGTYTPMHAYSHSTSPILDGAGYVGSASSPNLMGLGLSSMTLEGSAYGTPKSVTSGLLDDDDEKSQELSERESKLRRMEDVKIVGMDVEGDVEDGPASQDDKTPPKMDVDI